MSVTRPDTQDVTVTVDHTHRVSGLLHRPERATACYVLAHGAGAGMRSPFLEAIATGLGKARIATLRFQFPYMEQGLKRPDPPKLAHAAVRAAIAEACRLVPQLPLIAGGRSFGGRMTSQAQAASPLPKVHGLAFLGFPLHPSGSPSDERAIHLVDVQIPMLFLQGTRDALADLELIKQLVSRLGNRGTLKLVEHADHGFHVPARSGREDSEVRRELIEALAGWIDKIIARP
jgi:uncharacterized protein